MVAQVSLTSVAALLLLSGAPLSAQTRERPTQAQIEAAYNAHQADFDYLLGDWEFTAMSKEYGEFRGFWSATRLAEDAKILDEYRVVSDSGETWHVSHTLRTYNPVLNQWELVTIDGSSGLKNLGTGRKVGAEIHIEQRFGMTSPEPSIWRIRYYDIRPDGFSWNADRSTDEGKTWVPAFLRIEARRIGPARRMEPLAPARRTTGSK